MGFLAVIAFILAAWFFFDYHIQERDNPNRNITLTGTESEFTLKRNRAGHYVAPGTINGYPVTFLLDTGATQVSVPAQMGDRLKLIPGYSTQVQTANGIITVRTTTISELGFGPFIINNVQANLNPGMSDSEEILLGMSVLKQLEFTQRGDTLILRPHATE